MNFQKSGVYYWFKKGLALGRIQANYHCIYIYLHSFTSIKTLVSYLPLSFMENFKK